MRLTVLTPKGYKFRRSRRAAQLSFISLLGGLLFLSACAAGNDRSLRMNEVRQTLPAVFFRDDGRPVLPSPGRWWEDFHDPTLNRLMDEALANNLDLAQARARLVQARELAASGRALLFPTLNLGARLGREQSLSAGGELVGTSQSLSVAARYELDLWDKLGHESLAADLVAKASREDLKALSINLSAQVADFYFLAAEQRAQLALSDQTIAVLADTLVRVERRYREGLVGPLDLHQARQNLVEARSLRPSFSAALAKAEHGLALLLGRFPGPEAAGPLAELPAAPAAFPAGLPADLLKNRPDIEAAFLRLAASDARASAALADRFPTINLLAGYGTSRLDLGTSVLTGTVWNLLAELGQPLFDAGRREAEQRRNEALFEERMAAFRQTMLTAVREVEDALVANRTTEERLSRLGEHEQATGASLRLSLNNYFEGLSEYLPVLLAQQAHFRSQSSLLAARRQLLADRISLARALGGNFTKEQSRETTD